MRALICFILSFSSFALYASDKSFKSDTSLIIPIEYTIALNELQTNLDITILKGQWSKEMIFKRFEKLRRIYNKCDVGVTISSLREVEWKYSGNGLYYDLNDEFDDRYFDGTQQLLVDLELESSINVIFLDSFDEYMPKLATAFPPISVGTNSIALNSVWITNKVNNKEYLTKEPDSYSVFAHELGHILLNDSHVMSSEPNLMHYQLPLLNDELTSSQCSRIRKKITLSQEKKIKKVLNNHIEHFIEIQNGDDISSPLLKKSSVTPELRSALGKIGKTSIGNIIFNNILKKKSKFKFVEVTKLTDPDMVIAFRVGFDNLGPNTIHYSSDVESWKTMTLDGKAEKEGEEIMSSTLGSLIMHEIGHTQIGLDSLGYMIFTRDNYNRVLDETRAVKYFENVYRETYKLPLRKTYFTVGDSL
jgi:hypothetical protein